MSKGRNINQEVEIFIFNVPADVSGNSGKGRPGRTFVIGEYYAPDLSEERKVRCVVLATGAACVYDRMCDVCNVDEARGIC